MQDDYVAADLAQCRKLQLDVFGKGERHPCPHVLDVKGGFWCRHPLTVRGLVFVSDTAAPVTDSMRMKGMTTSAA